MRILILTDCYLPVLKSGAKLIHDLAIQLLREGNDVVILTPSDAIEETLSISVEDGLRVIRVKNGRIKGASKPIRALREVRLSAHLWNRACRFLCESPADLIIFYSPTIFLGGVVRRLKKLWNCPAYLILRDIFPQWAVDAGLLKKGLLWRFFRKKEIEQYDAADIIGVQSPANIDYFAEQLRDCNYRIEVLYNWASTNPPETGPAKFRERLGLKGKAIFFYGGNLGIAQDLDNVVRLASRLASHAHVGFLLVGEGSESQRLQSFISQKNLSNIRILPAMPEPEYLSLLSECDVGLISLDRRLKTHNVPGKLLGYMSLSKPVLASINPGNDLAQILEGHKAGICLENGDDDGLCEAALLLANDLELRSKMGQNSRALLEKLFTSTAAARQILRFAANHSAQHSGASLLRRSPWSRPAENLEQSK